MELFKLFPFWSFNWGSSFCFRIDTSSYRSFLSKQHFLVFWFLENSILLYLIDLFLRMFFLFIRELDISLSCLILMIIIFFIFVDCCIILNFFLINLRLGLNHISQLLFGIEKVFNNIREVCDGLISVSNKVFFINLPPFTIKLSKLWKNWKVCCLARLW